MRSTSLSTAPAAHGPTRPDSGEDVWDEAFALNFTAVRKLTTALLPAMRKAKWGRIVNISGSMEPRGLNAAIAAKGALHLWAKGLSCDVAKDGAHGWARLPWPLHPGKNTLEVKPRNAFDRDGLVSTVTIER